MRKLQITQSFENIQTIYDKPSITWTHECAHFLLNENTPQIGQIIVWLDGVAPEQIFTEIDGLKNKIKQFLLAMQVSNNARMRKKGLSQIKYYTKDGRVFDISTNFPEIVDIILKREGEKQWGEYTNRPFLQFGINNIGTNIPVSLPSMLPQVSLEFERLIGIFSAAENFSGPYLVEHQLLNYCLILEDLTRSGKLSKTKLHNSDLWKTKNFVSHAECNHEKTVSFIEENFSEAIMNKLGKKYALFDRTKESHINFIWKYRNEAYFLVKEQLAKELW
ncbi:MAG: hypothetical protein LUP96_01410 [Methylococcaceae bacterium]|nr:hypothetical protein [Methylococcaceae bacterium]